MIVKLNNNDITSEVNVKNFRVEDNRNSRADTMNLVLTQPNGNGTTPQGVDEIILENDGTRLFKGVIININKKLKPKRLVEYHITANSSAHELNRSDIVEKYSGMTVNEIIKNELVPNYAPSGFTTNNVNCDVFVETIAFNHVTLSDCLDKLALHTNFYWYVDYYDDIHFFAEADKDAPQDITQASPNHITGTLDLEEDYTQLKNVVKVRGGAADALQDDKDHTGDGQQTKFGTDIRFSEKPDVTVNGTTQNVGLAYLDDISNFDAVWSYREKFVKFDTAPANGDDIKFTGIPEAPILVESKDSQSVGEFGEWEFYMKDKNIESRGEAYERAQAEIEAGGEEIISGSFATYNEGFRSGQTMQITDSALDVDDTFVIERVQKKMVTPDDGTGKTKFRLNVEVSTNRRIDIVDFLQEQVFEEHLREDNTSTLLSFRIIDDTMTAGDSIGSRSTSSPPYEWGTMEWGYFTWS